MEERLSYGCFLAPKAHTKRAKTTLERLNLLDKRFKIFVGPDDMMALPVTKDAPFPALDFDPTVLDIATKYGGRWESALLPPALLCQQTAAETPEQLGVVRVAELFAGIGGFRLGCECAQTEKQFRVVYASEIDKWARQTYEANFGQAELHSQPDITSTTAQSIPPHDLLTGGFPCQTFSGLGKRKGLGEERGQLFQHIVRIARHHKPKVLLLENVIGLLTIDAGKALQAIIISLQQEAGYKVTYRVYDTADFGLPQHRKRVYFVCTRVDNVAAQFVWPDPPVQQSAPKLSNILERDADQLARYALTEHQWNKVQQQPYFQRHRDARLADVEGIAQTITSNYKSGYLLYSQFVPNQDVPDAPPRFLTPRECARLMGVPESFDILGCGNEGQFYRQIGNAVSPVVIKFVVEALVTQSLL